VPIIFSAYSLNISQLASSVGRGKKKVRQRKQHITGEDREEKIDE
jgi:hypothetical protein